MNVGNEVLVLEPFHESFSDTYVVREITQATDGQEVVFLEGVEAAFSPAYLEVISK